MATTAAEKHYNDATAGVAEEEMPGGNMLADIVRVSLRMPREMHERLTALAAANRRSLHAQILHMLATALSREG